MPRVIVSVVFGVLLSLAFPRAGLHWIAWFALAPLMYYVYRLSWRQVLVCGTAFGIGFFGSLLYWIAIFGKLPWLALSIFQTAFVVGFVVAAKLIGSRLESWGRLILLPALWVAFEWMRSLGPLGFTWGNIGYSQYEVLPVVQVASLTGIWGVSFILALSNSALANLMTARKRSCRLGTAYAQVLVAVLVVLTVVVFGSVSVCRPPDRGGQRIRAAVVQGNINQDADQDDRYRERTWRTYHTMTLSAAEEDAELVIWPETVVPGCAGSDPYIQRRLAELADVAGAYLLVGGLDEDDEGRQYNSAFLVAPGAGILGRYSKVHLVPFGEYVPARRYMPFLRHYKVTPYDTSPGPSYDLMDTGSCEIGTAICFESIFPDIPRRLTASGAELLCVITNDAWFGWTAAAEQHLAMSVFRAVENRRYLLRGAATGISCVIDPSGRILARAGLFRPAVLRSDVRALSQKTFYTKHGNWLVHACLAVVFLLLLVVLVRAGGLNRP